jgi:hypothetical protein
VVLQAGLAVGQLYLVLCRHPPLVLQAQERVVVGARLLALLLLVALLLGALVLDAAVRSQGRGGGEWRVGAAGLGPGAAGGWVRLAFDKEVLGEPGCGCVDVRAIRSTEVTLLAAGCCERPARSRVGGSIGGLSPRRGLVVDRLRGGPGHRLAVGLAILAACIGLLRLGVLCAAGAVGLGGPEKCGSESAGRLRGPGSQTAHAICMEISLPRRPGHGSPT